MPRNQPASAGLGQSEGARGEERRADKGALSLPLRGSGEGRGWAANDGSRGQRERVGVCVEGVHIENRDYKIGGGGFNSH